MKKLKGVGVTDGVAEGPARVILSVNELDEMQDGEVLVVKETTPRYIVPINKSAAVVIESDDPEPHAEKITDELSVPAVIGVKNATTEIETGNLIRVHGNHGEVEIIAERFHERTHELS